MKVSSSKPAVRSLALRCREHLHANLTTPEGLRVLIAIHGKWGSVKRTCNFRVCGRYHMYSALHMSFTTEPDQKASMYRKTPGESSSWTGLAPLINGWGGWVVRLMKQTIFFIVSTTGARWPDARRMRAVSYVEQY